MSFKSEESKKRHKESNERQKLKWIKKYNDNPKFCCECGKKISYKKRRNKFCNSSCAASYNNKKRKKIKYCQYCGEKIKGRGDLYCSKKCQDKYHYLIYINKWKLGLVDGIKGGVNVSNYIRTYLWRKYNNQCSRCGWKTPNPVTKKPILEIEHMDGDCMNNDEDNLDLICPNCHSLTTTYKALNTGNGNRKRLKYHKLI